MKKLLLASSVLIVSTVLAVPPIDKYNPGETSDPACAPGDINCDVDIESGMVWKKNVIEERVELGNLTDGGTRAANVNFFINNDGTVGIGTANPDGNLELKSENLSFRIGTNEVGTQKRPRLILEGDEGRVGLSMIGSRGVLNTDGAIFEYGGRIAETEAPFHEGTEDQVAAWYSTFRKDTFGSGTEGSFVFYRDTSHSATAPGNTSGSDWSLSLKPNLDAIFNKKVGIGTTNPQRMLHLSHANEGTLTMAAFENSNTTNNNSVTLSFRTSTTGVGATDFYETGAITANFVEHDHESQSTDLTFWAKEFGTWNQMVLKGSGNVGIGTLTPEAKLHMFSDSLNEGLVVEREGGKLRNVFQTYSDEAGEEPQIILRHFRGTKETPTETKEDDEIGAFHFSGYNQSNQASRILSSIYSYADSDLSTYGGGRLSFKTRRNNSDEFAVRMVIKNDGRIGIGTSEPDTKLDITDTDGFGIAVDNSVSKTGVNIFGSTGAGNYGHILGYSYELGDYNDLIIETGIVGSGSHIYMQTAANGGNTGIGTTDPKTRLEVSGIIKSTPTDSAVCDTDSEGGFYYNNIDKHFYGCNGTAWVQLDN